MEKSDVIAGLSVAGLMLPEAVAYAGIAGLPPQRAILAGIAGCLAYAVIGRSRFAIISPTSSSAAILAATLAALPGGADIKTAAATVVVALAGLFFLIAAAARLGGLTGFISRPVLRGFAFGLAITIIIKQLPILVGVHVPAPDIFDLVAKLVLALPTWNPASVAVGGCSLVILMLLKRLPAIPGAFLVLAGGVAASVFFGLPGRGVETVGAIDAMPSWPSIPRLDWSQYTHLGRLTLPLVLILFAESWGTIRAMALRHDDIVDANRELGALGISNIASALVQGMPVGAGFSAGAASEAAGSASRATGVIAALGLALLIAVASPLVARLPEPVLAAVVIAALGHALDPTPLIRLWRLDRDQYVALAAAAAVLVFGVLNGMLIAIGLSLAAVMQRLASPHVARLGRLGTTHDYVDVSRHPDAVVTPGIAILRPAEPLFFANVERVLGQILADIRAAPATRAVVVSLEESFDLDSTALDALVEFDQAVRKLGLAVRFARVHDHARDVLTSASATEILSACLFSVDDAVASLDAAPATS